jgi:hypothetical protein
MSKRSQCLVVSVLACMLLMHACLKHCRLVRIQHRLSALNNSHYEMLWHASGNCRMCLCCPELLCCSSTLDEHQATMGNGLLGRYVVTPGYHMMLTVAYTVDGTAETWTCEVCCMHQHCLYTDLVDSGHHIDCNSGHTLTPAAPVAQSRSCSSWSMLGALSSERLHAWYAKHSIV